MKYGICSDLHLDHYNVIQHMELQNKINSCEADVVLIAGDLTEDQNIAKGFFDELTIPYRFIPGNHDYYQRTLTSDWWEDEEFGIVAATLWTNFWNNPLSAMQAQMYIPDFTWIFKDIDWETITPTDMSTMFYEHKLHITESKHKIVMTHFGPSTHSIDPKYEFDVTNPYFTNNISDYEIDEMGKKLWIHGHMHSPVDYMIGDLRVVSNPLGYPFENGNTKGLDYYQIKIIEI